MRDQFIELLERSSSELYDDNRNLMDSPMFLPTPNIIDETDVQLLFLGLDAGLISLNRGGRFNTLDRAIPGGRWALLSRAKEGGWYNAEYLPQIAAYVDAILNLAYPPERVLFELPPRSLQLDLAILADDARVIVLGEAKRDIAMLPKLRSAVVGRFSHVEPDDASKRRGDEARQLAWRLWKVRPAYCWLIGPGERPAYACAYEPLDLVPTIGGLPPAVELGLDHRPPSLLPPPALV